MNTRVGGGGGGDKEERTEGEKRGVWGKMGKRV